MLKSPSFVSKSCTSKNRHIYPLKRKGQFCARVRRTVYYCGSALSSKEKNFKFILRRPIATQTIEIYKTEVPDDTSRFLENVIQIAQKT